MASKNAANAGLNTSRNRGMLSQLPEPGVSASGDSNNNLARELEANGASPLFGPVGAGAGVSPAALRASRGAGVSPIVRHGAQSSSKNIIERERQRTESVSSAGGPVSFIGRSGPVGAGGISLDYLAGPAEPLYEEPEVIEADIFDEFEEVPDLNADYAQDLFDDETLRNAPDALFDNLIEALETIEEQSENSNNEGVPNNEAVGILLALQNTKDKLIKLDHERSIKSSASSKNSARSMASVKESTEAVINLAKELIRVGTGGDEAAEAEVDLAAGVKRTRSGRESKPPTRSYDPEPVRRLIRSTKLKSKRPRPASLIASGMSDISNMTSLTATKAFLMAMKGSRIEGPSPDSQLKFIHGREVFDSINAETLCDLCGFALKYRQPDGYYKEGDKDYQQLKWSYDHTIPVNYAAAVLKIYLTGGRYSLQELFIMSFLGGPTCYHCNLFKSQQKFITCPNAKREKWQRLQVNIPAITSFLSNLLHSTLTGKNAKNDEGNTSLQRQIERIQPPLKTRADAHWINIRRDYLVQKCRRICDLIKLHVDYDSAYARVKLMRSVINGERAKLQGERMSPAEIKRKISKKARDALLNCQVQPWIASGPNAVDLRDVAAGGNYPFYSPVVPDFKFREERPWTSTGAERTRKRKQRKNRTRKNLRLR